MPAKGATKRPQHQIDEAVKRYLAGEPVTVLSKYYKISRPGFYLWVSKYKAEMLKKASQVNMTEADAKTADKRVLITENQALKAEVRKLRDKVLDMMIKAGEL